MATFPHVEDDPFEAGGAVQLTGPVGESLRGPCLVALQLPEREMPRMLAGVARLLVEDRVIYCADGCNRFDPYRFSHWARCARMDPRAVLERVRLSRAFTLHQMTALACDALPALPKEPPPFIVVLGVERLFLDEQVPVFERRHLFGRTVQALAALRRRGASLLVTVGEGDGSDGRPDVGPWLRQLGRVADVVTHLRSLAGGAIAFERDGHRAEPVRAAAPLLASTAGVPVEAQADVLA